MLRIGTTVLNKVTAKGNILIIKPKTVSLKFCSCAKVGNKGDTKE